MVRAAGALMVLAMALAAGLAWRLAQGPIVVPGLAARLARAVGSADGTTTAGIGSVELAWDTRRHEIDLLARDVRLARRGLPLLELPAVALEFALRPLLAGRLVLRAVELPNPHLTIARTPDGGFRIDADDTPGDDDSVATLLVSLAYPPRGGPLAELRRLEISGGVVTMEASADQPEWVLHDVSVTVVRGDGGLRVDATAEAAVDGRTLPLSVAGTVAPAVPDPAGASAVVVEATAATPLVPRGDLAQFWPGPFGADVRAWVLTHVRSGRARDLALALRGRFTAGAPAAFEAVEVRFDFDGMDLAVADGLPVITALRGRARGTAAGWSFDVARGNLGGLEVARGSVAIDGSGVPDPLVRVRAALRGGLPPALALVRALGGSAADLPSAGVSGTIDTSVAFDVPLGRPVDLARTVSVQGRLRDVTWRDVWGGRSLAAGDFAMDVARAQATVQGGARLAGVPVQIVTRQSLVSPAGTLEATARPDAGGRAALGFDGRPWLDGPTPLRATRTGDTIALDADLRDAVLAVQALGMAKPAGAPGTASARIGLRDGGIAAIDDARLDYGATRLAARGRFDAAGTLVSGTLDGTLGPVPGRATPSRIALRVSPGPAARAVTAETDDVDLLFRAAGMTADATGGALTFSGTLAAEPVALDGSAEARGFRLESAPMLARLLAMTSVPGLTTAFAGRGLEVTRLAARVAYRAGRITLADGTLESPSFGMRLAGTVDTVADAVDLRGALVPSYYGLNTLAGRVPVLGRVLTGTRGEGLQVFEFTVRGPTAAPRIVVDPVSSLAPGAVRDLIRLLPIPGRAR